MGDAHAKRRAEILDALRTRGADAVPDLVHDPTETSWDEAARALVQMGERECLALLVADRSPQTVKNERWMKLRDLLDDTSDSFRAPGRRPVGAFDALPPGIR